MSYLCRLVLFAVAPLTLCLSSCSTPTAATGFLGKDDALLVKDKAMPFQRSWKNPSAELWKYNKIAVRPMRTDRLQPLKGALQSVNQRNLGKTHQSDADELARYATTEMLGQLNASAGREAFYNTKSFPATARTMVLETNLVEVVPGRPSMQVVNFFVPFIGLLNRPSVAIEGRLVDARSGKTLLAFKDRETPEIALVDTQKFTYYGSQRRESTKWAKQLRTIIESEPNTAVKDDFFIKPLNW